MHVTKSMSNFTGVLLNQSQIRMRLRAYSRQPCMSKEEPEFIERFSTGAVPGEGTSINGDQ